MFIKLTSTATSYTDVCALAIFFSCLLSESGIIPLYILVATNIMEVISLKTCTCAQKESR